MKKLMATIALLALAIASLGLAAPVLSPQPLSGRLKVSMVGSEIVGNKYYELVTEIPDEIQQRVFKLQQKKGKHLIETAKATYLLVTTGEARSGGYTLDVTNVARQGNTLHVFVTQTQPALGEIVTMILTYPHVLLEIKTNKAKNIQVHMDTVVRQHAEMVDRVPTEIEDVVYANLQNRGHHLIQGDDATYLLIAAGERRSGGYVLDVTAVGLRGANLHVYIKETQPTPGEPVILMLTYPYVLLKLKTEAFDDVEVHWDRNTPQPIEEAPKSVSYRLMRTYLGLEKNIERAKSAGGEYVLKTTADKTVAVIALGARPTGGYGIEILSVERHGDSLAIRYRETKPGSDDMVTQAITYPYVLVEIDAVAENVRFAKVSNTDKQDDRDDVPFKVVDQLGNYIKLIDSIKTHRAHAIFDSKLIYLGLGTKPTAGYGLKVERIQQKGDVLYVFVQEFEPGDFAATVITHPYIVIRPDAEFKHVRAVGPNGVFVDIKPIIDEGNKRDPEQEQPDRSLPPGLSRIAERIRLAEALETQGKLKEALALLHEALEINPSNIPLYNQIMQIMRKLDNEAGPTGNAGPPLYVNGKKIELDKAFQLKDKHILVPVRQVAEALNASVSFNVANQQVFIKKHDMTVQLTIGSDVAVIKRGLHNERHVMRAKVVIQGNRTLVPIEDIASMFSDSIIRFLDY